MQNHTHKQFDQSSKLFDYCEECQCFHPAHYLNGILVMEPCESFILEPNYDQKIATETNVTLPSSQSANSFSSMSIKNHVSTSPKPHVVRPDKYRNLYLFPEQTSKPQLYSSKPSQKPILQKIPAISPQKTAQLKSRLKIIPSQKPQQRKTFASNKNTIVHTLVQNNQFTQNHIQKLSPSNHQPQQLPIIFANPLNSCFETPQFGSESRVSQNKQNSISSKRLIKQQKQFFVVPKVIEGRNQRTISQVSLQSDYFCCGYIGKFSK